jgi:Putative adhesin
MLHTLLVLGAMGGTMGLTLTALQSGPFPTGHARSGLPAAVPIVRSRAGALVAVVVPGLQKRVEDESEHESQGREKDKEKDKRSSKWSIVKGERIAKSFQVGDAGGLRVSNIAGDISVSGTDGGEIQVEAIKHGKGHSDGEAREQLGNVDVQIRQVGNRVEIDTTHQRHSRAWVDYIVTVPRGTSVDLKTVSGDVKLTDVKGEVRAESVSGDVVAASLGRVAALKSVSGDVQVSGIESDGDLSISNVSGDVHATSVKTRSAAVATVSGDVTLKACTCKEARLHSVSGGIEYSGRLTRGGRYELKSHSGDIILSTSEGFDLEAMTFSGDLRSAAPLSTAGGMRGPGKVFRGAVGGGGAFVEIKTFSGDIVLVKPQ